MAKDRIVGTQFSQAKAKGIFQGADLKINHDTNNQFDENALEVLYNNERLGYIGKQSDIYDISREMFPLDAKVVDFYFKQEEDNFTNHETDTLVSLTLEIEDVVELDPEDNIPSFNEEGVIINFNEKTHTYTYQGRILGGASVRLKDYIEEFDANFIAERCSKSWGLPTKFIKNTWKESGNISAMFGTSIHKALEFEDIYRHHTKKDGTRCFTIKHPMIKKIVEDFFEFYDKIGFEGKVIPEALVSDVENNQAGLIDRLLVKDWNNKICRIQDYKVNIDVEKKGFYCT